MLFACIFSFFLLSSPEINGTAEEVGQSTILNFQSIQKARKHARYNGLRSAIRKIWDKVSPDLLIGSRKSIVKRIRRKILSKSKKYLLGMTNISEKTVGNNFEWSATYRLDLSTLIGDIKRLLYKLPRKKTIWVFNWNLLSSSERSDLKSQFSGSIWKLKFKKKKYLKRSKRKNVLSLSISEKNKLWQIKYSYKPYFRNRKKRVRVEFTNINKSRKFLFVSLPQKMQDYFSLNNYYKFKLIVNGVDSPIEYMKLLFLLQRQEPGILKINSFALLNGNYSASFRINKNVSKQNLLKSVFLGKEIIYKRSFSSTGSMIFNIFRKISTETKEK